MRRPPFIPLAHSLLITMLSPILRVAILHFHVVVIFIRIFTFVTFQSVAFMEERERLDLCFEAGGCKAFQLTLSECSR